MTVISTLLSLFGSWCLGEKIAEYTERRKYNDWRYKKAAYPDQKNAANKNNIQVNNTIVCQGQTVTADYLIKQANQLADTNDQLRVIL